MCEEDVRMVGVMKKIVVLTGAGISAESGISTFRDSDTPEGRAKNRRTTLTPLK